MFFSAKINTLLEKVTLPKIVKVRQVFETAFVADVEKEVRGALVSLPEYRRVLSGMSIAVTGGSRGIDRIDKVTRCVCDMLKEKGALPFIVPSMGSHGGATSSGQIHVLQTLGITEDTMGCPIKSDMEVVQIGTLSNGLPVCVDKAAHEADGIVLINRIKPHTSFKGKYESGLMKMMAIGLGKREGADAYHRCGFKNMSKMIEEGGMSVLKHEKVLFGVALTENSYGKINSIHCLGASDIVKAEPEILKKAYKYLALPFFNDVDVMILCEIGKDISGTGCDPNVTGRFHNEHFRGDIHVSRMGILGLSAKSGGNANGVGMADFITQRLYDSIDIEQTYSNAITSTAAPAVKIPMILSSDKAVFRAAVKTSCIADFSKVRLSIFENTKNMKIIYISENMMNEAKSCGMEVCGEPFDIPFNEFGVLCLNFTH